MIEVLKRLTQCFGVSGNEEQVRNLIISEIKDNVDEIRTDVLGNLTAIKKGTGKKIMLAAHMDEIGLIVTHINDKGFLRFANSGGVSQFVTLGQRVMFGNGTPGVVFYEQKPDDMNDLKLSKMYIDIGAPNREEAERKVKTGDTACFEGSFTIQGDMAVSKAMDDRSGCAVLVDAIRRLDSTDNEVYFVFTVQKELGLRGAGTAAFGLVPDIAVAVDVSLAGDTPGIEAVEVKCGSGPAIKIKDSSFTVHPEIRKLLEDCAEGIGIPRQYDIQEKGETDAGAIQITAGGIPCGAISIPCRYVHSPAESVSLTDMENTVRLLLEVIRQYKGFKER